jgi:integrative and conjugative element protein (TIGR02256 family)
VQISQANIGIFSSLAVKRVLQDPVTPGREVEIWRMTDDGIQVTRSAAPLYREVSIDGWTISVSDHVIRSIMTARTAAGKCETGGILVGAWDRVRECAYIVDNFPPPPDSVATSTGFVRGEEGVFKTLETVEARTATNLTYIGEWHTHPPGYSSRPSADDRILLRWISDVLLFSDVPPLMLIAGHDGLRVLVGSNKQSALLSTSC